MASLSAFYGMKIANTVVIYTVHLLLRGRYRAKRLASWRTTCSVSIQHTPTSQLQDAKDIVLKIRNRGGFDLDAPIPLPKLEPTSRSGITWLAKFFGILLVCLY